MTDLSATVVPARHLISAPPFTPTVKPDAENLRDVLTVTRRDRDAALADVEQLRAALIKIGRSVGCHLADGVSTDFLMFVPGEVAAKLRRAGL